MLWLFRSDRISSVYIVGVRVCAGVCGCVRVCAGVRGCEQVCLGLHGCARICVGVHKCAQVVWICRGVCMGVG